MSFKSALTAIFFASLYAAPVCAQVMTPLANALPPQPAGVIRVQVSLQSTTPIGGNMPAEEQRALAENARLKLYESAKAECATLVKAFDADCKLLAVNASITNPYGALPASTSNVTAIYELTPRAH